MSASSVRTADLPPSKERSRSAWDCGCRWQVGSLIRSNGIPRRCPLRMELLRPGVASLGCDTAATPGRPVAE